MTNDIIKIIEEIAECEKIGHAILYTALPKELRWAWTDTVTDEIWYIRLTSAKKLSNTMARKYILSFIQGTASATTTINYINKLEGLKAFW